MRTTKFLSSLGLSVLLLLGNIARNVVSQTCEDPVAFSSQLLVQVISDQESPYDEDSVVDFLDDFQSAYESLLDDLCPDIPRDILEINATAAPSSALSPDEFCGNFSTTITVSVTGECTNNCTSLFDTSAPKKGGKKKGGKEGNEEKRKLGQGRHKGLNRLSPHRVLEECDSCPGLTREALLERLRTLVADRYDDQEPPTTPFCDVGDGGIIEFQPVEGCESRAITESFYWILDINIGDCQPGCPGSPITREDFLQELRWIVEFTNENFETIYASGDVCYTDAFTIDNLYLDEGTVEDLSCDVTRRRLARSTSFGLGGSGSGESRGGNDSSDNRRLATFSFDRRLNDPFVPEGFESQCFCNPEAPEEQVGQDQVLQVIQDQVASLTEAGFLSCVESADDVIVSSLPNCTQDELLLMLEIDLGADPYDIVLDYVYDEGEGAEGRRKVFEDLPVFGPADAYQNLTRAECVSKEACFFINITDTSNFGFAPGSVRVTLEDNEQVLVSEVVADDVESLTSRFGFCNLGFDCDICEEADCDDDCVAACNSYICRCEELDEGDCEDEEFKNLCPECLCNTTACPPGFCDGKCHVCDQCRDGTPRGTNEPPCSIFCGTSSIPCDSPLCAGCEDLYYGEGEGDAPARKLEIEGEGVCPPGFLLDECECEDSDENGVCDECISPESRLCPSCFCNDPKCDDCTGVCASYCDHCGEEECNPLVCVECSSECPPCCLGD